MNIRGRISLPRRDFARFGEQTVNDQTPDQSFLRLFDPQWNISRIAEHDPCILADPIPRLQGNGDCSPHNARIPCITMSFSWAAPVWGLGEGT